MPPPVLERTTPETAGDRAAETSDRENDAAMVMPSIVKSEPYIHLVRNEDGKIIDLLHRREGDHLPDPGESDMGLFSVSRSAYLELLPRFADEAVTGHATRERNFLPFFERFETAALNC